MIKTKYNNWFGTARIVGDNYGEMLNEEDRLNCQGYETYRTYVSHWTGNFVIKMRRSKGQLERRLE